MPKANTAPKAKLSKRINSSPRLRRNAPIAEHHRAAKQRDYHKTYAMKSLASDKRARKNIRLNPPAINPNNP